MTIETNFGIGDTAWIMEDNRPIGRIVGSIKTEIGPNTEEKTVVIYAYWDGKNWVAFNQSCAFPTKEALLQSL